MQKKQVVLFYAALLLLASQRINLSFAYDINNRWTRTQVDGRLNGFGDPATLLWSVVPDGIAYSRSPSSNVVSWLDNGWNVPLEDRTSDFTNREWWMVMDRAFEQLDRQTGLTFEYVQEISSSPIPDPRVVAPRSTSSSVDVSQFDFGDIRIGGDGAVGNAIADNTYPNGGDMRINTSGNVSAAFTTTTRSLYNLITHEVGHGLGLNHDRGDETLIMASTLQLSIAGPQWDMIYALNRNYGDPLEKNGGNDTAQRATNLGVVGSSNPVLLGEDAVDFAISEFDDQFLGIDTGTDMDWFRFEIPEDSLVNISVTPVGPTYTTNSLGTIIGTERENLNLTVFDGSLNEIAFLDSAIGLAETLSNLRADAGSELYLRVQNDSPGASNRRNQFYTLEVSSVPIPEPASGALIVIFGCVLFTLRTSRK